MQERLLEFIKSRGWTNAEFAKRVGISAQNVRSYLDGRLNIQNLFIKLYENGCDINWLISGDNGVKIRNPIEQSQAFISYQYAAFAGEVIHRLKTAFEDINVTYDGLISILGVHKNYIEAIFECEKSATLDFIFAVCDIYHFSAPYIFLGLGNIDDSYTDLMSILKSGKKYYEDNIRLHGQIEILKEMITAFQSNSTNYNADISKRNTSKLVAESMSESKYRK